VITLARVRAEAAKAVAEMGRGFSYTDGQSVECMYRKMNVGEFRSSSHGGGTYRMGEGPTLTPCIIGRILESLNLMTNHIRECTSSVSGLFGSGNSVVGRGPYYGLFEPLAVLYMNNLQVAQDSGRVWGAVYDLAERLIEIELEYQRMRRK